MQHLTGEESNLRAGHHFENHHVDWSTTPRLSGEKLVHLNLDLRKEDSKIHRVLEGHGPEIELFDRNEFFPVSHRLRELVRRYLELLPKGFHNGRVVSVEQRKNFTG